MNPESGHSNPLGNEPDGTKCAAILAENVMRLRTEAKLSKTKFALMVGIGRPFLNKIENGQANPRLLVLEKLAAALDTTPDYLITRHEPAPEKPACAAGLANEVRHARLF